MPLRKSVIAITLMLVSLMAQADDLSRSAEDIRDCSRKNFPDRTAVQKFDITAVDASGGETQQKGKFNWRVTEEDRTQINICFTHPTSLNGSCYLVLEKEDTDDIFVYLPALKKVKRVLGGATSQKLLGTDISYADVKQLQGLAAGGSLERLADTELDGQAAYLLEGRPDPAQQSPYTRVLSHVDKASCVPLQVDFYGLGDKLRKQLFVQRDSLQEVDGRWQVRDLLLKDLGTNSSTQIHFDKVEYDTEISRRVFNMRSFYVLN